MKTPKITHGHVVRVVPVTPPKGLFASPVMGSEPFEAVVYNSLCIDPATVPDELDVTAWSDPQNGSEPTIQGLMHKELPIWGVQYHPEVSSFPSSRVTDCSLSHRPTARSSCTRSSTRCTSTTVTRLSSLVLSVSSSRRAPTVLPRVRRQRAQPRRLLPRRRRRSLRRRDTSSRRKASAPLVRIGRRQRCTSAWCGVTQTASARSGLMERV